MIRSASLFSRVRTEDGFGIAELMVAIGVILATLVALLYTVMSGFTQIGFSRQRQAANGLAAQLIEQARGIAFAEIEKGLHTDNLTSDTNVESCGGVWKLKKLPACTGEEIVHSTRPPGDLAPLKPHKVNNVPVEETKLNRAVYVTKAPPGGVTFDADKHPYRVIARVSWDGLTDGPQSRVETETLIFSPEGCRSTLTHPFAAPCQPFLYGAAAAPAATFRVTDKGAEPPRFSGKILTPSARADVQDEQIARIVGVSAASTLQRGTQTSGGTSITTIADSDIATNDPAAYQSTPANPGPATTLTGSAVGYTLTLAQDTAGDSLDSVSAAAASDSGSPPPVCPTTPSPPASENDSRPCGRARVTQGGRLRGDLQVSGIPGLGQIRIADVGAAAAPVSAFVDRDPDTPATKPGKVVATASRSFGDIQLGALPSGVPAPGPNWRGYLIRLRGSTSDTLYSDTATAEAGTNASAPSFNLNGGTVEYWDDAVSDYRTHEVSSTTGAIPFGSDAGSGQRRFALTTTIGDISLVFTIRGSIEAGGVSIEDPDGAAPRTSAAATIKAPLVGTLNYTVTYGDISANFDVAVDLGTLTTETTYQPAPVA